VEPLRGKDSLMGAGGIKGKGGKNDLTERYRHLWGPANDDPQELRTLIPESTGTGPYPVASLRTSNSLVFN